MDTQGFHSTKEGFKDFHREDAIEDNAGFHSTKEGFKAETTRATKEALIKS